MNRSQGPGQGPLAPGAGREVMSEVGRSEDFKGTWGLRIE